MAMMMRMVSPKLVGIPDDCSSGELLTKLTLTARSVAPKAADDKLRLKFTIGLRAPVRLRATKRLDEAFIMKVDGEKERQKCPTNYKMRRTTKTVSLRLSFSLLRKCESRGQL